MGDFCIGEEIPDFALTANWDALSTTIVVDSFGFWTSLDSIFTHLLALTTYVSCQLLHFIEDLVYEELNEYAENFAALSSHSKSSSHLHKSNEGSGSSSSTYSFDESSPGIQRRKALDICKTLLVNTYEVIQSRCNCRGISLISKGLMFPVSCFRIAWSLAFGLWRQLCYYIASVHVQVHSIASRVHKTLHGSSDDIGWLQSTPGMAPVEDGTDRFLELLSKIRDGEHMLPNSFVYLLIPGLFSNHGPLYFVGTKKFFSKMGLACHIAKIHSEASVEHNAWELKQYIEELYWGSGKQVMLLGHSKGGVDAAAALSIYGCELKDKVAGLALVQSPYGGTPIASDILREGQIADKETRRIMELLICKLIKGDIRALEDLTYDKRKEFILKHKKIPERIPLISFHSEASVAPGVLATLTHIAQAELPWLPIPQFGNREYDDVVQAGRQVPVAIPISAAMAICALHLQLRYGEKSDGLVTRRDAEVPGSVAVRLDRKFDHAWMVYSTRKKDPIEPDSCEMCEALFTMIVELGDSKQETDDNHHRCCKTKVNLSS